MAMNDMSLGLVLILFVTIIIIGEQNEVKAQSGCTSVMLRLSPCLSYVTGKSSTPSTSCCSQLTTVVQSQPQCLCSVMNGGGSSLGITINQTLALSLPTACSVKTPPVSRCNGATGSGSDGTPPLTSPVGSPSRDTTSDKTPADQTPTMSSQPVFSSGISGSKDVHREDGSTTSNGMNIHFRSNLFTFFIATCALTTILTF